MLRKYRNQQILIILGIINKKQKRYKAIII